MAISSITGAAVPPTPPPQARAESLVEGTTADGDSDGDDTSRSSNTVTQTSSTAQITETLGNNINVSA